jgi:hypothetical protein
MDKQIHSLTLLILGCLFCYGVESYFPFPGFCRNAGILCFIAAGFSALQSISGAVGDLAYADMVGEPIDFGTFTYTVEKRK